MRVRHELGHEAALVREPSSPRDPFCTGGFFLELKNSSDDLSKAHKFIDSNFQRSQVKKFSVNDDKIELIFKANLDNEKNLEEIELALKNLNITDNFSLSEELIIN